jgi:hypothetical protein
LRKMGFESVTLISVRGIGRSFGWNGPHTPQHCSGTSSDTFDVT